MILARIDDLQLREIARRMERSGYSFSDKEGKDCQCMLLCWSMEITSAEALFETKSVLPSG